ncbi:MAG: hypothetical protein ABI197_04335 [Granulicella sp.]
MIIILVFMAGIVLVGAILFYKAKGKPKKERVEQTPQVLPKARTSGEGDD